MLAAEPERMRDRDSERARAGGPTDDDARLLIDNVTDYAMFLLDLGGNVATWSVGAQRLTGFERDEVVGAHVSRLHTESDVLGGKPASALAEARARGRFEEEGRRVRRDGSTFWANVSITALHDPRGELKGFGVVMRDVTAQKQLDEALRASEERFHRLVDAVTDYAIFMLDTDGRVATWNVGAARIKGYTATEIIGTHFEAFYTPEDRAAGKPARVLDVVRREGRFEDEGYRLRKDGKAFWANVVITSLENARGELSGFVKVTRDLTERRHAEQTERDLVRAEAARVAAESSERVVRDSETRAQESAKLAEAAAARAEEANRMKDEFLATVSHELRTPLNSIVGWAFILRERNKDPGCEPAVEAIHRNAQAQVRIVDDILDVSRIITGKLALDPQPMDLTLVVREALDVIAPSATAKNVHVDFTVEEALPAYVGDSERLRQVAWNLLSNAVKFTPRGGAVRVMLGSAEGACVLTVSDTGSGIAKDVLPRVFDRFTQADSSSTRRFGGLGLGLAIVRHVVELHGGTVHAASEGEGRGATFTVVLPVRTERGPTDAGGGLQIGGRAKEAEKLLRARTVLVVDDDEDARFLLESLLLAQGATVLVAASVSAARKALARGGVDVVVSDIGMPGEDGFALARTLNEGGQPLPAIALTAFASPEDRRRALEAGFSSYLAKPVDPEGLVAAIVTAMLPRA